MGTTTEKNVLMMQSSPTLSVEHLLRSLPKNSRQSQAMNGSTKDLVEATLISTLSAREDTEGSKQDESYGVCANSYKKLALLLTPSAVEARLSHSKNASEIWKKSLER